MCVFEYCEGCGTVRFKPVLPNDCKLCGESRFSEVK